MMRVICIGGLIYIGIFYMTRMIYDGIFYIMGMIYIAG